MKNRYCVLVLMIFTLACNQPESGRQLTGPYLGQEPPGETPELFAPGIISHGFHELGLALSPDLDEMLYIMSDREYAHYVIVTLSRKDGDWSSPEVAPFTGSDSNYSLCFSRDGRRLYFSSKRPHPGSTESRKDFDIWFMEKGESELS